jgi:thiol-disulfide isomerase/thioredoxin
MKRIATTLLVGGLISIGLLGQTALKPGSLVPDFKLNDLNGKAFKSSQLKGSVVLLDLWATWCEPCIADIPMLNRLHEKFGSRGLKVVGIAVESGWVKDIKPHVAKLGVKYPVLVGTEQIVEQYEMIGFPTTYLIGRDGKLVKKYLGTLPDQEKEKEMEMRRDIEALLR